MINSNNKLITKIITIPHTNKALVNALLSECERITDSLNSDNFTRRYESSMSTIKNFSLTYNLNLRIK